MKILHICNWVGGITTRNVAALKQYSRHAHELVVRMDHCYDMATEPAHLTEKNTTREMVLRLADEADALHFHAVGYDGTEALPETLHGIDWSALRGKKPFFLHGMVSDLLSDGTWTKRHGARFEVRHLDHYAALFGPHLSCKKTYQSRLEYVPDMIPIREWLYTPCAVAKHNVAATFKNPEVVAECERQNLALRFLPTPTKLTDQLDWRRRACKATFDNATDGHWGLFGIESLAQGVPCIAHTDKTNRECWTLVGAPEPPFFSCEYGGADVPHLLREIFAADESLWKNWSVIARHWIDRFYNPRLLVRRWDAVYDLIEHGR